MATVQYPQVSARALSAALDGFEKIVGAGSVSATVERGMPSSSAASLSDKTSTPVSGVGTLIGM